jgi:hypothetical protein
MREFVLNIGDEIKLSSLGFKDIEIIAIEAPSFQYLLTTIGIISETHRGKKQIPFYVGQYVTGYQRHPTTGKIKKVIRNCKTKKLKILENTKDNISLTVHYKEAKFTIDTITINISKQMEGYVYSLHPKSFIEIKEAFSKSFVSSNVFIAYDVKISFELMHGPVFSHVITALTGLDPNELEGVREIEFIDPLTKSIVYSFYND